MSNQFGKRGLVTVSQEVDKRSRANRVTQTPTDLRLNETTGGAFRPLSYLVGGGILAAAVGLLLALTSHDHPGKVTAPTPSVAAVVDGAPVEEENIKELLKQQQAERERMEREEAEREKLREEEDKRWERAQAERVRRNAEEARHAEQMDLERKTAARLEEQHREQIEQNERIAQQRARAEQQRRKEEERRHQERLAQEKRTEKAIREANKSRGTPGALIVPTLPTKRMFNDGPGLFERD